MPVTMTDVRTSEDATLPAELDFIFESAFDLFAILGPSGDIRKLAGPIFASMKAQPGMLVGQRLAETVIWQSSEDTPKLLDRAIAEAAAGSDVRLTLDLRLRSAQNVPMDVLMRRFGADGSIFIGARALAAPDQTPASDRRNDEADHLLLAAENASFGLYVSDDAANRIYASPRFNELFGLPPHGSYEFDDYRDAVHPEDRDFVDDFLGRAREKGRSYEEQFRLQDRDGTVKWISMKGEAQLDDAGRPLRVIGVAQDITEQKYAAEELSRVHAREIRARQEAVDANRAKDFFLAFVSHEIRSPLNAILGWARILLTKKVDDDARRNALETIERSARFQTKLINDLVDSARVASGKLRLEYRPTDVVQILRDSIQAQRPSAEARGIELTFSTIKEMVGMIADSNRLQQVFGNLISNAIKFTPDGGWIKVEATSSPETIDITVTDSGSGIEPDALPHIFKQFSQPYSDHAKSNLGLGLGLSIVKVLVNKHGGIVRAESDGPGTGARFTVTLPLTDSVVLRSDTDSGRLPDLAPLSGISILIVEDDPDSREVLHLFLEQNGAQVKSFDLVRSAMSAITDGTIAPDLIISDLGMPEDDGFAFISKIRAMELTHGGSTPAIALSAFTANEIREKALKLGFNAYCTKPFDHDGLIEQIVRLARKGGAAASRPETPATTA